MLSITILDDSPSQSFFTNSNSIIEQFLNINNFQQAWFKVSAKQSNSAGIDNETIADFGNNLTYNLTQLIDSIANNNYQPLPCKQVFIPKKKNQLRELKIPTIKDRIIQHALLNVLTPLIEPKFFSCSFAYRPNLSYINAVEKIAQWRDNGYFFVIDADIVKFFDNINHQRLLTEIEKIFDNSQSSLTSPQTNFKKEEINFILGLIKTWISVGVSTKNGQIPATKGVPQGAVISPFLANIYLHEFDQILTYSDLKLVRYADDFLVLANSQERIITAFSQVVEILKDMNLELHQNKTQVTNFDRGFRFLGHGFLQNAIFPLESNSAKSSKKKSSSKWKQGKRKKKKR